MRPAPPWLADFQARFGTVVRTPLDRATGTLRATPDAYDPAVDARDAHNASSRERLAVYNRQYWFRLFTVFQDSFPLITRLLGHWSFNDYVARFLLACPPRGWDIDDATLGFAAHFAALLDTARVSPSGTEREALIEAVAVDVAWRSVLRALHEHRPRDARGDRQELCVEQAPPVLKLLDQPRRASERSPAATKDRA